MRRQLRDGMRSRLAPVGIAGAILAGGGMALAGPIGIGVVADSSVVSSSSDVASPTPSSGDPTISPTPSLAGAGVGMPNTAAAVLDRALTIGLGLVVLLAVVGVLATLVRRKITPQ